ncbi:hypothetical protein ACUY1T_01810 [Billgrantia sp. Q4P2]|uniref:hypothetical protein n=1 Tax=Billgrantia sp. Q4P2 TaxID=3463857 RepID=UPI004056D89A
MTTRVIEVAKFRAKYRYSFDDEYFYLFWKKGLRTLVHDRYPLSEMSAELDHWRGRPHSTVTNIKKSIFWLVVSIVVFILASSPLTLSISVFAFVVSGLLLLNEIGFLFPVSATILDYEDLSGSVYMFHGGKGSEDWSAFERGLSDAIRASKLSRT